MIKSASLNQSQNGFSRAKAAKLFIDNYYADLIVSQSKEKNDRGRKIDDKSIESVSNEEEQERLHRAQREHRRAMRKKKNVTDFMNIKLIGRGAFGEVRLVQEKDSGRYFAMKIVNKSFIIEKNQIAHTRAERDALVANDNAFVVKLYYCFQDELFVFFVMEFLAGGDMMSMLFREEVLTEDMCRFYIVELVLAVKSVHDAGFIHRDLKPDNILIDSDGHIKLSDFGLCTSGAESHLSSFYQATIPKNFDPAELENWKENNRHAQNTYSNSSESKKEKWNETRKIQSYSTVGTVNYMAPEILLGDIYGPEVDWWAVGIILYECLVGYAPFGCVEPTDTCMMILEHETYLEFPDDVPISSEAKDLILCLLSEPSGRYGYDKIKKHPWFFGVHWKHTKKNIAPWVPDLKDPEDTTYFDKIDDDTGDLFFQDANELPEPLMHLGTQHLPFVGWTYRRFTGVNHLNSSKKKSRRLSVLKVFKESEDTEKQELDILNEEQTENHEQSETKDHTELTKDQPDEKPTKKKPKKKHHKSSDLDKKQKRKSRRKSAKVPSHKLRTSRK